MSCCAVSPGLELTLNLTTPALTVHRSVCGVLTCKKIYAANASQVGESASSLSITSMIISKITSTSTKGENEEVWTPLATLTLDRPEINRVSNEMKVVGTLEARWARLSLEISDGEDCHAQFSCELRTSDGQGNELVQTNRLQQDQELRAPRVNATTSVAFLQQLALLQQQMTLMGASLENKLADFGRKLREVDGRPESKIEDKFEALGTRLDAFENRLEDKVFSVHTDIESLKEDISNKIETRVVDKLCQLETKLPDSAAPIGADAWMKVEEGLSKVREEQERSAILFASIISNTTMEMVSYLQENLGEIFTQHRSGLDVNNLTATMRDILGNAGNGCFGMQNVSLNLDKILQMNFENLTLGLDNSAAKALSLTRNLSSPINTTVKYMYDKTPQTTPETNPDTTPKTTQETIPKTTPTTTLRTTPEILVTAQACKRGEPYPMSDTKHPYVVIPPSQESGLNVPYLCDTVTDGGGWVVIQRRTTGNVDFYRNWDSYKQGFGSVDDDFWLGNANIHALTRYGSWELRVDLQYKGNSTFARYDSFSIGDETTNYVLRLGEYSGTAGDDLSYHKDYPFSTHDRDNDPHSRFNCAADYSGAWWYFACYKSNLNGKWNTKGTKGMVWVELTDYTDSVSSSEMKIRKIPSG